MSLIQQKAGETPMAVSTKTFKLDSV